MRFQIENRIRDELAGAMERRLPASFRFYELRAAICAQVFLLLGRDVPYFTPSACVDWVEFGRDDVWWWSGERGWRFGGEEARDEVFLEAGGGLVGDGGGEVEVQEGPHWA
jgi:hypothetical protein